MYMPGGGRGHTCDHATNRGSPDVNTHHAMRGELGSTGRNDDKHTHDTCFSNSLSRGTSVRMNVLPVPTEPKGRGYHVRHPVWNTRCLVGITPEGIFYILTLAQLILGTS